MPDFSQIGSPQKIDRLAIALITCFTFSLLFAATPAAAYLSHAIPALRVAKIYNKTLEGYCNRAVYNSCYPARSSNLEATFSNYENSERLHNVAIFERDGRQAIWDLLVRDRSHLTEEERAILQAASRIGMLECGNGWVNATLIQLIDGQDAILASAHTLVDTGTGRPRCDFTQMEYLPNVTFYTGEVTDFNIRGVQVDGSSPFNLESVRRPGAIPTNGDFLIFKLSENVSQDLLPNGEVRGFMKLAENVSNIGIRYLIGYNNDFRMAETPSYEACYSGLDGPSFYHFCATEPTSSGSVIAELVNGEMVVSAINKGEWNEYKGQEISPLPKDLNGGNFGVNVESIKRNLANSSTQAVVY